MHVLNPNDAMHGFPDGWQVPEFCLGLSKKTGCQRADVPAEDSVVCSRVFIQQTAVGLEYKHVGQLT